MWLAKIKTMKWYSAVLLDRSLASSSSERDFIEQLIVANAENHSQCQNELEESWRRQRIVEHRVKDCRTHWENWVTESMNLWFIGVHRDQGACDLGPLHVFYGCVAWCYCQLLLGATHDGDYLWHFCLLLETFSS